MKVGINGMGRMGRLALRAAFGAVDRPHDDPRAGNRLQVVHLNEIKGNAESTAHLVQFDTVQGRWRGDIAAESADRIRIWASPSTPQHPIFLGVTWMWTWCWNAPANSSRPKPCKATWIVGPNASSWPPR